MPDTLRMSVDECMDAGNHPTQFVLACSPDRVLSHDGKTSQACRPVCGEENDDPSRRGRLVRERGVSTPDTDVAVMARNRVKQKSELRSDQHERETDIGKSPGHGACSPKSPNTRLVKSAMPRTKDEMRSAIESITEDACADCGLPLGNDWTTRLNAAGDRQERVHRG